LQKSNFRRAYEELTVTILGKDIGFASGWHPARAKFQLARRGRSLGEMQMSRRPILIMLVAVALGPLSAGPAQARYGRGNYASAAYRQRMIQFAQAQLGAARRAQGLAQVQMKQSQSQVDADNARIRGAKTSLGTAKTDEHDSHLALEEIQTQLIDAAGPTSEIGKAQAALLAAEAEFESAAKRVLGSDDYKAQSAAVSDHSERLKRLPEIREAAFRHDDEYQNKLARLKIERAKFGQLRTEMVRNSSEWTEMSQAVRDALKEQHHAETEAINGGFAKMSAKYRLRDAQQVYAAATSAANQSEAILRRLGVNPPPPPPSLNSSLAK
jgi:uncharacterized protein YciI